MSTAGVLAGKGYVQIGLNDAPLMSGIRQMQARMRAAGESIRAAGAGMFSIGATGIGALIPAVLSASDAAEGFNRFQAVMGDEAARTDEKLEEMAKRIGRVKSELRDTSSSFQGLLVGLGMTKAEAADTSTQLTELSLDFASFNNLSDADASERFLAGLSGSGEVFDRFGINIKDAQLKIKLAQMGITGTATELQKAQARIAIIQDSMARQGATKDATTTAGSFANQLKAIAAEAKKAAQEVGTTLMPELQKYTPHIREAVGSMGKWLSQNPQLIVQVGKLVVALTAGGVAMMAIGQAVIAGSQALGLLSGAWKILQPLLAPKDMLQWVNACEKATTAFKVFSAGLAVAAIVAVAYELSNAREEFQKFNDELDRNSRMNDRLRKARGERDEKADKPKTKAEIEAALQMEEKNMAGMQSSIAGLEKQIAKTRKEWEESSTAFGMNPFGGAAVESDLADLKEMRDRLEQLRDRSLKLREQLEANKKAEADSAAQKDAKKKAKSAASLASLFPDEIAGNLVGQGMKGADALNWNFRKMLAQFQQPATDYKGIAESITGTFSGAALSGQSASISLAKKQEEIAQETATNTGEIVKKIDELAKALSFG